MKCLIGKLVAGTAAVLFLLMAVSGDCPAKEYCVTTLESLEAALQEAATNRQNDTVRIQLGVDVTGVQYVPELGHRLTVETGYNLDCSEKLIQPGSGSDKDATLRRTPRSSFEKPSSAPPPPQRSTTGPIPPPGVEMNTKPNMLGALSASGGAQHVLGLPAYLWRHGCGPTAAGMVLGYYDIGQFPDLFDGDASIQTAQVNQGIASQTGSSWGGHYEDYSLPIETSSTPLQDRSETGGAHASDCIADFMHTSWSLDGNLYGWSYSDKVGPAIESYVALRNSSYRVATQGYIYAYAPMELSWEVLTAEIDQGRPMIFLVDTDANGYTDHFVAIVGYRDSPIRQYGCLDTWNDIAVRWQDFRGMAAGVSWGIWGGLSVKMTAPTSYAPIPALHLLLLN